MKKIFTGAVIVVVLAVGALWAVASSSRPSVTIAQSVLDSPGDAKHGAYLARAGDCIACHTAKGGTPFAGGVPFDTPVGKVWSTNITSDREHGIGGYTFEQFVAVMREGVRKDGARLYPAMPYTSYAKVSDADLRDLYAYFTQDVPASAQPNRAPDIVWPLSIRWPLAFWNRAFHHDRPFVADTTKSVEWNRGAYLVEGLAHCGSCHTARGVAYQELALDASSDLYLAGASLNGSAPISLRSAANGGLDRWSVQDIVATLKTGRNARTSVSGPMGEVVEHSTQYLSDADLNAIAVYLKSLGGAGDAHPFNANDATLHSILAGTATSRGASIYIDSCAACHRQNGQGASHVFPSLADNPMVTQDNPDSLIHVILAGARLPSTEHAPSPLAMPPFAWRYDDNDVAQLATFVRASWGNHAPAVTADQVAKARARLAAN